MKNIRNGDFQSERRFELILQHVSLLSWTSGLYCATSLIRDVRDTMSTIAESLDLQCMENWRFITHRAIKDNVATNSNPSFTLQE